MSKRVLVNEAEYLKPIDYERFGAFPQAALDQVVSDAVGYPAHWAAFTVAKKSAQEIVVSPGRFFENQVVYAADAIQTLNLTLHLPLAASDERWVALILRGETVQQQEQRAIETSTDPETSLPVATPVPVIEHRAVKIVVQQGLASPAPALYPVIAETDACIAFVRLTTQGVQNIEPGERWRVKNLFEIGGRVTALELGFEAVKVRTEVLETGMSNANAAIDELRRAQIRPEIFRQVRRDVAAMRRQLNVPEGARTDYYDPALTMDFWDGTHGLWRARIDEGVQMPFETSKQARLEIRNEDDARLKFAGRRMVPAYDEVKRIFNEGGRATRLISQNTHVEIEAIQRTVSKTRTAFGPTINFCQNQAEWSNYTAAAQAGATFSKDGTTYQGLGKNEAASYGAHQVYQARSVKTVSYTETYWEYIPKTVGLNGSVYGETFLVDQPLICPAIELEFAKVDTDGAVYVVFCATTETGAPIIDDVIGVAKLEAAQLKLGWNRFVPDLTNFDPGKRFAFFTVTNGNHQLYGSNANAYAGGTSFRYSDGAWAQGDVEFDFNFRIYGCRFPNARTVVDFKPMDLAGGLTQFKLLYPNWVPEGTGLAWEIQPVFGGQDMPWSPLAEVANDANPLVGLPSSVNLRCTLLATPDLAPMIELNAEATYETARVRSDFCAVSKAIPLGLTTTSFQTLDFVDDFDPATHTFTPGIIVGTETTIRPPAVITTILDPDKPARRGFLAAYTVPSGTSVVRHAPRGSTTNVVDVFFIENVAGFAL